MAKQIRFTKREFLEAYRHNDEKDFLLVLRYLRARNYKRIEEITGDSLEAACWPEEAYNNCETPRWEIEYFNAGDPYIPCIMRVNNNGVKGAWRIAPTGDFIERHFKEV